MIQTTALSYWQFCRAYNQLAPAARRMVLAGEALLKLRDETNPHIRRRLARFISEECEDLGVIDKTANFV